MHMQVNGRRIAEVNRLYSTKYSFFFFFYLLDHAIELKIIYVMMSSFTYSVVHRFIVFKTA